MKSTTNKLSTNTDVATQKSSAAQDRHREDHVSRIVGEFFGVEKNELVVGGFRVTEIVEKFGSPLFVYDQNSITAKLDAVRSCLPDNFELYYSIKANPNAALLRHFLDQGCGLEVASAGEMVQALAAGCTPQRVIFAGPGKTEPELDAALDAAIREIHVESIEEARCLNRLATQRNTTANIAIRVNPVDASGGAMQMGGKPSPFGVDEESLGAFMDETVEMSNLKISGVHLFMGTQILDAEILRAQYQKALSIARQVANRLDHPLTSIDFGGGWGTPYFPHESELDLSAVKLILDEVATAMNEDPRLTTATGVLEPGRFLVNEAGIYLARVTRIKSSRGKTFAVIDGGMHHHLAASGNLGQTIKRNYPVAVVNKIGLENEGPVQIVGPLCTPLDTIGRNVDLPGMQPGDLIGVFQSGAYARTSSPLGFLSHASPAEVLVSDGNLHLIRRRGEPQDCLRDQTS